MERFLIKSLLMLIAPVIALAGLLAVIALLAWAAPSPTARIQRFLSKGHLFALLGLGSTDPALERPLTVTRRKQAAIIGLTLALVGAAAVAFVLASPWVAGTLYLAAGLVGLGLPRARGLLSQRVGRRDRFEADPARYFDDPKSSIVLYADIDRPDEPRQWRGGPTDDEAPLLIHPTATWVPCRSDRCNCKSACGWLRDRRTARPELRDRPTGFGEAMKPVTDVLCG